MCLKNAFFHIWNQDKKPREFLRNESAILRTLNGTGGVPKLLGLAKDGSYLKTTCVKGANANQQKALIQKQPKVFLHQLLCKLRPVHQAGIAHGDLSSANIMVAFNQKEELNFLCLVDFGFARASQEYCEAQISRGTIPFISTLARCGVLASFPADLESCFALALWAATGDVPWTTLQQQIKVFADFKSRFPSDPLVQLLLASANFSKSDLVSFDLRLVATSSMWDAFNNNSGSPSMVGVQSAEPPISDIKAPLSEAAVETKNDCPVSDEGGSLEGAKNKFNCPTKVLPSDPPVVASFGDHENVRCGEEYLSTICRATPAWRVVVSIPRDAGVLRQFRKFQNQRSTEFDLLGGSGLEVAKLEAKSIPWTELASLLQPCARPIIIGESTRIVSPLSHFSLEKHLVKLELRATLIHFVLNGADKCDPRGMEGLRVVLVLRTHDQVLFEAAQGWLLQQLEDQSFRYGRLNFLLAQGMFDIKQDADTSSETSELMMSMGREFESCSFFQVSGVHGFVGEDPAIQEADALVNSLRIALDIFTAEKNLKAMELTVLTLQEAMAARKELGKRG